MRIAARGVSCTQKDEKANKDGKSKGTKKDCPPILLYCFLEACSIKQENHQNSWAILTFRKVVCPLGKCSALSSMTKNPASHKV